MIATTVAIVVFLGVLTALGLVWLGRRTSRLAARAELARRLGPGGGSGGRTHALDLVAHHRDDPLLPWLGVPGQRLHGLTLRAGSHLGLSGLVGVTFLLALAGSLLILVVNPGPLALLGIVAGGIPSVVLVYRARHRSRDITYQMPDALDLMSRSLRSGHALGDALRITATEMPPPIQDILAPAAEEHRLGLELRDVLQNLSERLPGNFEIRLFASSVLLHRDTGGNLVEILDHLSDTIRERLVFHEKVKSLTAEVRASALILTLLPIIVAGSLIVVSPGYLDPLVTWRVGRMLLVSAITSVVIGALLMRRLSRVEP